MDTPGLTVRYCARQFGDGRAVGVVDKCATAAHGVNSLAGAEGPFLQDGEPGAGTQSARTIAIRRSARSWPGHNQAASNRMTELQGDSCWVCPHAEMC